MLNFNGHLVAENEFSISSHNRAFKYGDAVFETIKIIEGSIVFSEDHYFRLMASMRMLRMEIPMNFTLEFFEEQILKAVQSVENVSRIRFTVYRKDGGFYTPITHEIDYVVEPVTGQYEVKPTYTVDLFKDHYVNSGLLSSVKTNNRILNVLAGIYSKENNLDNCILLNEKKSVVEAINANIFIVKENMVKTPAVLDGCVKGIARKKIIELIEADDELTIEETQISPFEIQKADEVFITNAIIGIQPVTNYRKKQFNTEISVSLTNRLQELMKRP